jgi:hypothetical protein
MLVLGWLSGRGRGVGKIFSTNSRNLIDAGSYCIVRSEIEKCFGWISSELWAKYIRRAESFCKFLKDSKADCRQMLSCNLVAVNVACDRLLLWDLSNGHSVFDLGALSIWPGPHSVLVPGTVSDLPAQCLPWDISIWPRCIQYLTRSHPVFDPVTPVFDPVALSISTRDS